MSEGTGNTPNKRDLEEGIQRDFSRSMSYGDYLRLDVLLSAQQPLSDPPQHDELLFIVQHQTSELWLKLMIHELRSARALLRTDDLSPALKRMARIKHIQHTLTDQWSVLATLTPSEYAEIRPFLATSSGFQSAQYRTMEFLLGNKNAAMLPVFAHDPEAAEILRDALVAPSLYDEVLAFLARTGHAIPADCLQRDWSIPHVFNAALVPMLERIYSDSERYWVEYQLCEDLVDLETQFQLWRFRHMRTVMRIIGFKRGTGGSSGVGFLKQALELTFFPELFEVRTVIDRAPDPLSPG